MKLDDSVTGAIFLALALAVLWNIQGFPKIPGQNVGPSAFPGLIASILAGCSIALIFRGLRQRAAQGGGPALLVLQPWTRSPKHLLMFCLTIATVAGYVLFAEKIGFLICGIVMLTALMLCLGVRAPVVFAVAPIATFAIHVIFYKGLRVPLPWGIVPILY